MIRRSGCGLGKSRVVVDRRGGSGRLRAKTFVVGVRRGCWNDLVVKKSKLLPYWQVLEDVVLAENFESQREGCELEERVKQGRLLISTRRKESEIAVEIVHGLGVGCLDQARTHLKDRCKLSVVLHIVEDLEDVVVECQQRV